MKTFQSVAIAWSLILLAGCVTEGGVAIQPQSAEEQATANLALGIGYLQQGRPTLAVDALLRAIDLAPRSVDAHSTLAIAYDQIEDVESAEVHHRRATQLAPQNPGPHNAYAVFLCRQNRWADARPEFDSAIQNAGGLRPDNYLMNAATCARAGGDLRAAETYYRSALQIDAANIEALRGLVDVLMRSDNYLSARAFWQQLESRAPLNAEDLLSCYLIETSLGDARAASDCANRLRQDFPGSTPLRQLRELEGNAG